MYVVARVVGYYFALKFWINARVVGVALTEFNYVKFVTNVAGDELYALTRCRVIGASKVGETRIKVVDEFRVFRRAFGENNHAFANL